MRAQPSHRRAGPRITMVTISFNQGRHLEACMRSVLEQRDADFEYIVVDAGSTDGSRDVIARHAQRLAAVVMEPDAGPADGLNKGFARATGEIFGYLNADDVLLPGALARVTAWFREAGRADVIYADGLMIDAEGRVIERMFSTRWSLDGYLHRAANTVQQATFVRASAFRRAGGFNTANRCCWDGELLVDLALSGARFARRHGALGAFRMHSESITGRGDHAARIGVELERMFRKARGRPPHALDHAAVPLYRLWKIASHPRASLAKAQDRFLRALAPPPR